MPSIHPFQNLKQKAFGNIIMKGTIILTLTGLSTRILGFYNRIFLSQLIGAKELGLYQLIFPLYMVIFSLTTYGNELALTKLVSEYHAKDDDSTCVKLLQVCLLVNAILGLFISVIIYRYSNFLCVRILKAPECNPCLKILAYGIPFMAAKGAVHGYFLGLKRSGVHGISDLLEQAAKIAGLYILSYLCIQSSYDAAFAVWGIVLGEIASFLFSVAALFHHFRHMKSIPSSTVRHCVCLLVFLKNALPFTTNRLALTVLQSIEAILIPSVLLRYYGSSSISLSVYGTFTGMAFPFIMFPATITNSLATMLLPAVSSMKANASKKGLVKLCRKSMFICLAIGLVSTIFFYLFGSQIGICFFQSKQAGRYIIQLSILCPFIYLSTTLASILNGLGYATHNLILTFAATIIRISFIILGIPKIGMNSYLAGLFASYLFLTCSCLFKLQKEIFLIKKKEFRLRNSPPAAGHIK